MEDAADSSRTGVSLSPEVFPKDEPDHGNKSESKGKKKRAIEEKFHELKSKTKGKGNKNNERRVSVSSSDEGEASKKMERRHVGVMERIRRFGSRDELDTLSNDDEKANTKEKKKEKKKKYDKERSASRENVLENTRKSSGEGVTLGFLGRPKVKSPSEVSSSDEEEFAKEVLRSVNSRRKNHGVKKLKVNKEMNEFASEWTKMLARGHNVKDRKFQKYGKTVYTKSLTHSKEKVKGEEVVDEWYKEIENYNFGGEPNNADLIKNGAQLLWSDSREIGIARTRDEEKENLFVAAYFSPKGNVVGEYNKQVPPLGGFTSDEDSTTNQQPKGGEKSNKKNFITQVLDKFRRSSDGDIDVQKKEKKEHFGHIGHRQGKYIMNVGGTTETKNSEHNSKSNFYVVTTKDIEQTKQSLRKSEVILQQNVVKEIEVDEIRSVGDDNRKLSSSSSSDEGDKSAENRDPSLVKKNDSLTEEVLHMLPPMNNNNMPEVMKENSPTAVENNPISGQDEDQINKKKNKDNFSSEDSSSSSSDDNFVNDSKLGCDKEGRDSMDKQQIHESLKVKAENENNTETEIIKPELILASKITYPPKCGTTEVNYESPMQKVDSDSSDEEKITCRNTDPIIITDKTKIAVLSVKQETPPNRQSLSSTSSEYEKVSQEKLEFIKPVIAIKPLVQNNHLKMKTDSNSSDGEEEYKSQSPKVENSGNNVLENLDKERRMSISSSDNEDSLSESDKRENLQEPVTQESDLKKGLFGNLKTYLQKKENSESSSEDETKCEKSSLENENTNIERESMLLSNEGEKKHLFVKNGSKAHVLPDSKNNTDKNLSQKETSISSSSEDSNSDDDMRSKAEFGSQTPTGTNLSTFINHDLQKSDSYDKIQTENKIEEVSITEISQKNTIIGNEAPKNTEEHFQRKDSSSSSSSDADEKEKSSTENSLSSAAFNVGGSQDVSKPMVGEIKEWLQSQSSSQEEVFQDTFNKNSSTRLEADNIPGNTATLVVVNENLWQQSSSYSSTSDDESHNIKVEDHSLSKSNNSSYRHGLLSQDLKNELREESSSSSIEDGSNKETFENSKIEKSSESTFEEVSKINVIKDIKLHAMHEKTHDLDSDSSDNETQRKIIEAPNEPKELLSKTLEKEEINKHIEQVTKKVTESTSSEEDQEIVSHDNEKQNSDDRRKSDIRKSSSSSSDEDAEIKISDQLEIKDNSSLSCQENGAKVPKTNSTSNNSKTFISKLKGCFERKRSVSSSSDEQNNCNNFKGNKDEIHHTSTNILEKETFIKSKTIINKDDSSSSDENDSHRASVVEGTYIAKLKHLFENTNTEKVRNSEKLGAEVSSFSQEVDYDEFKNDILNYLNNYRIQHHARPLILSAQLNRIAADRANSFASGMIGNIPNYLGENVFFYPSSGRLLKDAAEYIVSNWYHTNAFYEYGVEPTEFDIRAGPFTQLIWRKSRELGVGLNANVRENKTTVVAIFSPGGNLRGRFQQEVRPLNSEALTSSSSESEDEVDSPKHQAFGAKDAFINISVTDLMTATPVIVTYSPLSSDLTDGSALSKPATITKDSCSFSFENSLNGNQNCGLSEKPKETSDGKVSLLQDLKKSAKEVENEIESYESKDIESENYKGHTRRTSVSEYLRNNSHSDSEESQKSFNKSGYSKSSTAEIGVKNKDVSPEEESETEREFGVHNYAKEMVNAINELRKQHQTGPLLPQEKMNESCQVRCKELLYRGEVSINLDASVGENIYVGQQLSAEELIQLWYSERKTYDFEKEPSWGISNAPNFTQMMWKSSEFFGGFCSSLGEGRMVVVAAFSPRGNISGRFLDEVHPRRENTELSSPKGKEEARRNFMTSLSSKDDDREVDDFQESLLRVSSDLTLLQQFKKEIEVKNREMEEAVLKMKKRLEKIGSGDFSDPQKLEESSLMNNKHKEEEASASLANGTNCPKQETSNSDTQTNIDVGNKSESFHITSMEDIPTNMPIQDDKKPGKMDKLLQGKMTLEEEGRMNEKISFSGSEARLPLDPQSKYLFEKNFLGNLNDFRQLHQVQPLTLNRELCELADNILNEIQVGKKASGSSFQKVFGEIFLILDFHENQVTASRIVEIWDKAAKEFPFGEEPLMLTPEIGNLCQVLWKSTREVGFAMLQIPRKNEVHFLAFFDPKGNWRGMYSSQVLPSKCEDISHTRADGDSSHPSSMDHSQSKIPKTLDGSEHWNIGAKGTSSRSSSESSSSLEDSIVKSKNQIQKWDTDKFPIDLLDSINRQRNKRGAHNLTLSNKLIEASLKIGLCSAVDDKIDLIENQNFESVISCENIHSQYTRVLPQRVADSWLKLRRRRSRSIYEREEDTSQRKGNFDEMLSKRLRQFGAAIVYTCHRKAFVVASFK